MFGNTVQLSCCCFTHSESTGIVSKCQFEERQSRLVKPTSDDATEVSLIPVKCHLPIVLAILGLLNKKSLTEGGLIFLKHFVIPGGRMHYKYMDNC